MFNQIDLDQIDLNAEPPMNEPLRQYYYMAKLKKLVKERSEALGHPLSCCIKTFGCQMNARDSEKLRGILEIAGYELSDSEESDLVLYNTCTVRENANQKVYGHLGYLSSLKKKNPGMVIALCGCMMQEPEVVDKIQKSYRFVDLVFGTHNIYKFAELLVTSLESHSMVVDLWKDTDKIVEDLPSERTYSFKSGVNIMFGCNNFCSYCIVPYVRGRERSRKPEDIIKEIEALVKDGVVEVMLLGQNVNSYGKNLDEPVTFAQLLQMVEKIDGLERIRFMTSHPKDLSDELIEVMKHSKKICRHLHLPLQAGADSVLHDMNRQYNTAEFARLIRRVEEEIPGVAISTDIIVGFPGETEQDFDDTMAMVERVGFAAAYTFQYSPRTGTRAAAMENQIPAEVKSERLQRLNELQTRMTEQNNRKYIHATGEVLVEGAGQRDGSDIAFGKLSNFKMVYFPGDARLIGRYAEVCVQSIKGNSLFGVLKEEMK